MTHRTITEEELQAIEGRASGAAEGPWRAERDQDDPSRCAGIFGEGGCIPIVKTDSGVYPPDWETAKFIAAARGDVPDLVAEVRRLQAALREARESDGRHHQGMEILRREVPGRIAAVQAAVEEERRACAQLAADLGNGGAGPQSLQATSEAWAMRFAARILAKAIMARKP